MSPVGAIFVPFALKTGTKLLHYLPPSIVERVRRRTGNGGDMGGKRKKCRKERVGSVAANSDNLGSNKEAGRGAQGAQGSSKICTSRESVSPLSRLIRGFRDKHH